MRIGALHIILILFFCTLSYVLNVHAAEPTVKNQSFYPDTVNGEYRTALAGEAARVNYFGDHFDIPARDRSNTLALTLGVTSFNPAVGGVDALPIAALYWRRESDRTRTRLVFSVFVNELDHALKYDRFELLGHVENNTVPFPSTEIEGGKEVKESSIIWGQASAWLGIGYRVPVAPFQVDNDLRVQLFYEGGYLFSDRTKDTGSQVRLPPDTYAHGLRLRMRYDGMRRNMLELLHDGFAAGGDLELGQRARWSDANYGGDTFQKGVTQEFMKLSGYLLAATPVPGLSERNRLIFSLYGGLAPGHHLDRFSVFRIGGGPFPNESDDLSRSPYPGAQFNQFPVSDYLVGTIEYRKELLAFLYLHLRGTFAWVDRDVLFAPHPLEIDEKVGDAFSVGLTSGLPWDSTIYMEYSHDNGTLRDGTPGDSVLVLWSKSF